MDMDIVVTKDDSKTNVQLIKNGKPTFWVFCGAALELAADISIAYGAYRLIKLIKK